VKEVINLNTVPEQLLCVNEQQRPDEKEYRKNYTNKTRECSDVGSYELGDQKEQGKANKIKSQYTVSHAISSFWNENEKGKERCLYGPWNNNPTHIKRLAMENLLNVVSRVNEIWKHSLGELQFTRRYFDNPTLYAAAEGVMPNLRLNNLAKDETSEKPTPTVTSFTLRRCSVNIFMATDSRRWVKNWWGVHENMSLNCRKK
jgi:hypothetical protein